MTDALNAAPDGPQTDTLAEQVEIPKPVDNLMPEEDEKPEPKAEAKKSTEEKRSDSVKSAIDKALGTDKDEEDKPKKAEPAPKADKKAEAEDAPKDGEKAALEAKEKAEEQPKPEAKPTAYKEAPSGFDEPAKKEWANVPESVRGAVHRRFQEMERGIHTHQQTAKEYEPIRKYADMAKQHGTDLATALHRYTSMEETLRKSPIQGLQAVVANLGLKKTDGTPVTLRDVAANIMGQTPDQTASRQEATINQLTQTISQLQQQISGFSEHVEKQQQETRTASVENEWAAFQQANERATELQDSIAEFLQKYPSENMPVSERLRDAYNWAVAQNPKTEDPSVAHTDPQPLVQTQTPPKANPAGQKSISGAGGNNAKSGSRKLSRQDAINKALAAAGL